MKAQESDKKKESQSAGPSFHCGGFQKMAEMMGGFGSSQGEAIDCCSSMMKRMARCKAEESKGTGRTQEPTGSGEEA